MAIKSPFKGMTMSKMVASRQEASYPSDNQTFNQSPTESARNYKITALLNEKNYRGMIITRVVLPKDIPKGADTDEALAAIHKAQAARQMEFYRQASEPWGSQFMPLQASAGRLNNPGMQQMYQQKQLAPPSTYGQFYAFMHAISAAFGNG